MVEKFKEEKEKLTQRAYLNSITGFIDFSTKQGVGFFLNPIYISILGPFIYGIWKIISQLNNYMTISDINVSQTLKILIARERSILSEDSLKKYFTASIYANLFFVPLYLLLGVVIIYISPYICSVDEKYFNEIRICMSILIISFIVKQIFSLFEGVLRGMNMAYKRIGIRALITIIGGCLTAYVLYQGYGIIGMASVSVFTAFLIGITIWWIVNKHVSWFGVTKINLADIKQMIKKSGKFMIERFTRTIYKTIDVILLGYFAGPLFVTTYVTSKFLVNASIGVTNKILPAVTPGFGKLIGEKKYENLINIRSNMIFIISYFGLASGIIICLFNKSFISLWIGQEYFVGSIETFLIVFLGIIYVTQEVDSSLINMTLKIRSKIKLVCFSLFLIFILGFLFIPVIDIKGLLIALILGRLLVSFGYIRIFKKKLDIKKINNSILSFNHQFFYLIILFISSFIGEYIIISNWFILIFLIIIVFTSFNLIMWFLFFNALQKEFILNLQRKINFFNKK